MTNQNPTQRFGGGSVKIKLKELLLPQPKSKVKAGVGTETGKYKFFTSSPIQSKYYDEANYNQPALIFGTGGNASVHFCAEEFTTSTDCLVTYGTSKANLEMIYYYLRNYIYLLKDGFKGAGLKHISKDYILNIEIDFPNEEIQEKIVLELRKIDSLVKFRIQQRDFLDRLVKSRFVEMFGKSEFQKVSLGSVCSKITDGTHKTPKYQAEGITFISAKNIIGNAINYSDVKYISESEYWDIQNRCQTEMNDIVLSKSGTLGVPAIIRTEQKLGLFESLAILKYDRHKLLPEFLCEQLKSDNVQRQFVSGTKGVAVKHLHLGVIANTIIILPPLELQQQFADFVKKVDKSKYYSLLSLECCRLAANKYRQEWGI
ncbi:MAG: restriction endonuclease subunit S [Clostridiales bacterium]|nr:restriction endonuclease subunit S [Clostridiales bacterium]